MSETGFDSFVVLAGMRTGSNFLESSLNEIDGVQCLGEVFNPSFIGYPNKEALFGWDLPTREARPLDLLEAIKGTGADLLGFRFFHDHDPRVLSAVLADRRCAKIVLTRSPLDSYVSWKLAQETGQWKLRHLRKRRQAQAVFDLPEYLEFEEAVTDFHAHVRRTLQESGQTAFALHYDDLNAVAVLNGLAMFLGVLGRLTQVSSRIKVQNPEPLSRKVSNYIEMMDDLSGLSVERVEKLNSPAPARSAAIKSYVGGANCPLLYLPIQPGLAAPVCRWMAQVDNVPEAALSTSFTWRDLRRWKKTHKEHRSFTIVQHPLERAHTAFCTHILEPDGPRTYRLIRRTLQRDYGFDFPKDFGNVEEHQQAFARFLEFLKANLAGQTSVRVDSAWCLQSSAVTGFAQQAAPDFIWRAQEVETELPVLAKRLTGHEVPPLRLQDDSVVTPVSLAAVYNADIETLAHEVYQRDYHQFGFGPWT